MEFSKDTVYISAASQNRDNFAQQLERLTPLLAARVLNGIKSYLTNGDTLRVELWNNYGKKMDDAYPDNPTDRTQVFDRLLAERRDFLKNNLGIQEQAKIIADSDDDTQAWIKEKIVRMHEDGKITTSRKEMTICNNCDTSLAVGKNLSKLTCPDCKECDFRNEKRDHLYLSLSLDASNIPIISPGNHNYLKGVLAGLPEKAWIERPRKNGLSLDFIGSNKMVLDPKIALSLMPEMLIEKYEGLNHIVMLVGQSAVRNIAPYTTTVSPDIPIHYALVSYIPNNIDISTILNNWDIDFFTKFVPLLALSKTKGISSEELDRRYKQYSSTKVKFRNIRAYAAKYDGSKTHPEITDLLTENLQKAAITKTDEAINDTSTLIRKTLSSKCTPGECPSQEMLEKINDGIQLIYGQT